MVNLQKYIEMLKNLKNQNQLELFFYFKIIQSQIYYNQKEKYFYLIQEYLTKTIYSNSFRDKFFTIRSQDKKTQEILENHFQLLSTFSIDSESDGFIYVIDEIYNLSFLVENGRVSENEFRDLVEKIFLNEMQKYFYN